jgi:hypothetical protein
VILVVLFASCFLLIEQPNVKAQSGSNIVNIPLTFHDYSLLLSDSNGSFCVLDGADGAAATSTTSKQRNLISEISGTQSGFSYWSASALWIIKLESDLHVVGTVNIRAYISSTFSLSGLFSGGGYGFGLVDIDQNNNEVQEFITQGPISIGRNPFSASPAQYSLNVNVDYVFKKGHSIGFAVGLGATTQGFTATVYYDSINQNSGATLPVEDTSQSNSFLVNYNDASHNVAVVSNSAIGDWQFNSASSSFKFTVQLINYTSGYCNVSIPKTLMQKPFSVTQSSHTMTSTLTENLTYYQVYFTNIRSSVPIQITGTPISPTASPTSTATATSGPSSAPDSSNSPSSTPQTSNSPNSTPTQTTSPTFLPSSTPSIPEFSWLVVLPLLAIMLFVAVKLKSKTLASALFEKFDCSYLSSC